MAKLLDILINPNPILRKVSVDTDLASVTTKEFENLVADMKKTMIEKDGVGLAAPQIGKNIRLVVINTQDGQLCLINPKITKKSWAKESGEEGCLSVPGVYKNISRHKKVTCSYTDEKKQKVKIEASGLLARVIQHELDHLDGILFLDRFKEEKKNNSKTNGSKN